MHLLSQNEWLAEIIIRQSIEPLYMQGPNPAECFRS
jgi:hypothetical protein